MFQTFGYFCLSLIIYSYVGYPIVLFFLSILKRKVPTDQSGSAPRGISIIVTCRNEQAVIRDKIENTFSLKFYGKKVSEILKEEFPSVDLIIASDASDDQTHNIVKEFECAGVRLVVLTERRGKESAQKEALKFANHEIILFTDSKIFLYENLLETLVEYFRDPRVGAVSSQDEVIDEKGQSGEGFYVQYEMWVRELETKVYSLIGLSGSCFAVRKRITTNFPEGVPSDFCMLLESRRHGLRGVHAGDVVAKYHAVKSAEAEFDRKVRTILRGMNSIWLYRTLIFSNKDWFLTFQIVSHKLFRWLVPVFGMLLFLVSFCNIFENIFWLFVFIAGLTIFALGAKGYIDPTSKRSPYVKLCFFFCLTNLAILVAWKRFIMGKDQPLWNPSDKG